MNTNIPKFIKTLDKKIKNKNYDIYTKIQKDFDINLNKGFVNINELENHK